MLKFGDVAKLARIAKYHNFAICIGFPILKNGVNFYTKCHKFRLLGAPGSVKIGSGADLVGILKSGAAIFEISIFWSVSDLFIPKNGVFLKNKLNFSLNCKSWATGST